MRQIKFRAKTNDGDLVCGDLVTGEKTFIKNFSGVFEVVPKSVAQLCGYHNGVEIYEGDLLTNENGTARATLNFSWQKV